MKTPKSVNERFHRMTGEELQENLEYWIEKAKTSPPGASGIAADKFVADIEREIEKRGKK